MTGGWVIEDGALAHCARGDAPSSPMMSFEDFELTLEWKVEPGGNSGIFYRAAPGGGGNLPQRAPNCRYWTTRAMPTGAAR